MTTYWCEKAVLPSGVAAGVRVDVEDGRIRSVEENADAEGAVRLSGVVLPGFANTHSHAFHRALRGRAHADGGTFWTWREGMYHVAARLTPDNYFDLARATFAEMALAGMTSVGEFHYVHHQPGGTPYADPNAMGEALRAAAHEAGIRLTLLDTLYLAGGLTADGHTPLNDEQLRFGDRDVDAWSARVSRMEPDATTRIGAAIHSVRAVPFEQLRRAPAAIGDIAPDAVVHAHVSEQPAENDACLAHYGRTPVAHLADAGLLTDRFTAVHATHLAEADIALLADAKAYAGFCPTTERDLADGIGPAKALRDSGARITLGSDQHAVVDMFEEMRAVEMHERLVTNERGRFAPEDLLAMATAHESLGWHDTGRIEVGARADLVAIRSDSPRTAGARPGQIQFAATTADVADVIRDGEQIVTDGVHRVGDVGTLLAHAIDAVWEDA